MRSPPRAALLKRPHLVRAGALRPRRAGHRLSPRRLARSLSASPDLSLSWAIASSGRRAPDGRTDAMRLVAQKPGVAGTVAIRLRTSGARIARELIVSVPRTLPPDRVAAIRAELATRSGKQRPQADLTITANPIALDDEPIVERVRLIGTRLRLPVHDVVIQDVGGRKSVAFDLDVHSALYSRARS